MCTIVFPAVCYLHLYVQSTGIELEFIATFKLLEVNFGTGLHSQAKSGLIQGLD